MNKTYKDLFEVIKNEKGISPLWLKILNMLEGLEPKARDAALKLFCIYFSLLDDGNICIALDEKILIKKLSHHIYFSFFPKFFYNHPFWQILL